MLETDEVDVDYFTPAESTSLANIFGKGADETKENPTLKYIPPPPPSSKPEIKPTLWIFTCAVHGFEWSSSGYISRGKLGLAILKIVKTSSHSIILYDSNKTTVAYATISPKLKIHKRDALTISFYDNGQKYWSIQTSDDDMNKMLQLLQNLQANVIHKSFQETDREQSDNKIDHKVDVADKDKFDEQKDEKEVDTDSYMNQKTKDSILKRMANMGHSVLPSHGVLKGQASDSSDSDDVDDGKKSIRHKPSKNISRKSMDINIQESEVPMANQQRKTVHKSNMTIDGESQSSKTNNSVCGIDMNIFVSEQRMNNSELRINVNRMSDKIDLVLERLNDIVNTDKSNTSSNFQNDIVQKLIKEYECKIKNYEDLLISRGIDYYSPNSSSNTQIEKTKMEDLLNNETYKNQIEDLQKACLEKETIIARLNSEKMVLIEKNTKLEEEKNNITDNLLKEIRMVNDNLKDNGEDIITIKKIIEKESNQDNSDLANRVKKIMNDTFQGISTNFNDDETYSGESLKAIIATVIKTTTKEALKDL